VSSPTVPLLSPLLPLLTPNPAAAIVAKSNVLARAPVRAKIASRRVSLARTMPFHRRRARKEAEQRSSLNFAKTNANLSFQQLSLLNSASRDTLFPPMLLVRPACSLQASWRAASSSFFAMSIRHSPSSTANAPKTP
jgi:hypothetical protein